LPPVCSRNQPKPLSAFEPEYFEIAAIQREHGVDGLPIREVE
jgi:hypothetical protein